MAINTLDLSTLSLTRVGFLQVEAIFDELEDFFEYTTWTPSYGNEGAGSWGTITTNYAQYINFNEMLAIRIFAVGTITGSVTGLTFTPPIDLTSEIGQTGGCFVQDGTALALAAAMFSNVSDVLTVRQYDNAAIGVGTDRGLSVNAILKAL